MWRDRRRNPASEAGVGGKEFKTTTKLPVGGPTGPLWSWSYRWTAIVLVTQTGMSQRQQKKYIFNVIKLVDSIYPQLALHASLIGAEIWNQGKLFKT